MGHITLMPHVGVVMACASGKTIKLGDENFELSAVEAGEWFDYGGVRVRIPPGARLVLCLPFTAGTPKHEVTLEIMK